MSATGSGVRPKPRGAPAETWRQALRRRSVNAAASENRPPRPINGSGLAVLGRLDGVSVSVSLGVVVGVVWFMRCCSIRRCSSVCCCSGLPGAGVVDGVVLGFVMFGLVLGVVVLGVVVLGVSVGVVVLGFVVPGCVTDVPVGYVC